MDATICERCQSSEATHCCACQFPVLPYCSPCFQLHLSDSCCIDCAEHSELPLSAYYIDSQATVEALRKLSPAYIKSKEVYSSIEVLKETYRRSFEELLESIQEYQSALIRELEEVDSNTAAAMACTAENIIYNSTSAHTETAAISAYLDNVLSGLEAAKREAEDWSLANVSQTVKSAMAVHFPVYQKFEKVANLDVDLSFPSGKSLGVHTLNARMQIKEVKRKIAAKQRIPCFDLFFQEIMLQPGDTLEKYQLPHLAALTLYPKITVKFGKKMEEMLINDTETVLSLTPRLISLNWSLKKAHYLLAGDQVLSPDSPLLGTSVDLDFEVIECERLGEVLLVRDEAGELFKLEVGTRDMCVEEVKHCLAGIIAYDEDFQQLSYRSETLSDDTKLSSLHLLSGMY